MTAAEATAAAHATGQAATAQAVAAMARGNWALADHLVFGLADAYAQGDFDTTYAAVYAQYREAAHR